jgi:zinc protease
VETVKKAQLQRITMPITQTHIIIGQPLIARDDADFFPLYVGNHILGGSGFGSRLMNEIREQRGLAYDTHSYFVPMAAAGPFRAAVQTRNDQAEEARRLLQETVSRFVAEGPTDDEMHKAIRNISGNFPLNIDSNSDLIGYLGMIGFYNYPLDHLQTFVSRVQAVTAEQVRDVFKRRLHPENFSTVIVGGAAEEK